jgi:type III secretion protein Q
MIDAPVRVHFRWGATDLTLSDARSLAPGDIVLADYVCQEPNAVLAVIGEHLVAPVRITHDGLQLAAQPMPLKGTAYGWCSADAPAHNLAGSTHHGDVPVRLFFEIGQIDMSLSQLRGLRPGVMIAGSQLPGGRFMLVAGQSCIGFGQPTSIGNRPAIRIVHG